MHINATVFPQYPGARLNVKVPQESDDVLAAHRADAFANNVEATVSGLDLGHNTRTFEFLLPSSQGTLDERALADIGEKLYGLPTVLRYHGPRAYVSIGNKKATVRMDASRGYLPGVGRVAESGFRFHVSGDGIEALMEASEDHLSHVIERLSDEGIVVVPETEREATYTI